MIREPFFGVENEIQATTAWSNPLITHQIHQSHIETLTSMCAKRFEWENVVDVRTIGKRSDSNLPMALGTASHEFISGIVSGKVMPGKESQDFKDEMFNKHVLPQLSNDDDYNNIGKQWLINNEVVLKYILNHTRLSDLHDEKPFVIPQVSDLIGSNVTKDWALAGRMDLAEINESTKTLRIFDYKFRGRSNPNRNKSSAQSSMYALAGYYYGYTPSFTYLEVVRGKLIEHHIDVSLEKLEWLYERLRQSIQMFESGVYPMNVGGWWCSAKYCKFWDVCRGRYEDSDTE
jgi:hypothetical protein